MLRLQQLRRKRQSRRRTQRSKDSAWRGGV
jgi:hypothetical protein